MGELNYILNVVLSFIFQVSKFFSFNILLTKVDINNKKNNAYYTSISEGEGTELILKPQNSLFFPIQVLKT